MTSNSLLAAVHVVLLLGIFGFIVSYRPDEQTRYRPAVSLFAASLAGSALALVIQIATQMNASCQPPQVWPVLFTACVFVAVASTRGNVAKLLPRIPWSTRP